jgi:hypothetical protein
MVLVVFLLFFSLSHFFSVVRLDIDPFLLLIFSKQPENPASIFFLYLIKKTAITELYQFFFLFRSLKNNCAIQTGGDSHLIFLSEGCTTETN